MARNDRGGVKELDWSDFRSGARKKRVSSWRNSNGMTKALIEARLRTRGDNVQLRCATSRRRRDDGGEGRLTDGREESAFCAEAASAEQLGAFA